MLDLASVGFYVLFVCGLPIHWGTVNRIIFIQIESVELKIHRRRSHRVAPLMVRIQYSTTAHRAKY